MNSVAQRYKGGPDPDPAPGTNALQDPDPDAYNNNLLVFSLGTQHPKRGEARKASWLAYGMVPLLLQVGYMKTCGILCLPVSLSLCHTAPPPPPRLGQPSASTYLVYTGTITAGTGIACCFSTGLSYLPISLWMGTRKRMVLLPSLV
jgi:hypothetical protein